MKVERTTFLDEGIKEPCIIVSNHNVEVRISVCYHLVGRNNLLMRETIDGEFNQEEEFTGDFDGLTDEDAIRLAKEFSAYL